MSEKFTTAIITSTIKELKHSGTYTLGIAAPHISSYLEVNNKNGLALKLMINMM